MSGSILGIDPGLSGGLALFDNGVLRVQAMPTLAHRGKNTLDLAALTHTFVAWAPEHVWIEQQQAMPKQGVSSSWKTGYHFGLLMGLIHGLKLPVSTVQPVTWKKALGVPADKTSARLRASQLLPAYSDEWARVKDDGLAEAALIALYGHRAQGGL